MDTAKFKEKYKDLTKALLKRYMNNREHDNVVFSPFSIIMLLDIMADAAGANTKDEIVKTLCGDMTYDEVQEMLKQLQQKLTEDGVLNTANAVIVKDGIRQSIVKDYEKRIEEKFAGKLFSSKNIVQELNAWTVEKTKGMISQIADDSMKDMLFFLANAIAFEAEWEEEYEDIDLINEDFTNADQSVSRVKMLKSVEDTYIENEKYEGFTKPYKDVGFSYVAMLPKDKIYTISEGDIDDVFNSSFRKAPNTIVSVKMPEFKYSFDDQLKEAFGEMGIKAAFTPEADFTGFSSEWLKIESVFHKAFIEVDRKGTKAAAISFAAGNAGGIPDFEIEYKQIILDRPFIYAIVHNETGIPVFVGVTKYIDPLTGDDLMTEDEKDEICRPLFENICSWMFGDDWDGCIETGRNSPEYKLYNKAHIAYYKKNIKELQAVADEVNDYLDRNASPGQKIVNRIMRKK